MGKFDWAKLHEGGDAGHDVPPPPPHRGGTPPPLPHRSPLQLLLTLALGLAVIYGGYFWLIRRVVVPAGKVLVLLKKDGTLARRRSDHHLRPPDAKTDPAGYKQWEDKDSDVNGILEQVYSEGTYFGFSPFDYERTVISPEVVDATAIVPTHGKVGIIVKKFGDKLATVRRCWPILSRGQRGPLPNVFQPGSLQRIFQYLRV